LIERSATCPLCKIDLYEEEEEESVDFLMGQVYEAEGQDFMALKSYNIARRIERWLHVRDMGPWNSHKAILRLLVKEGATSEQIASYANDMTKSLAYEVEGDDLAERHEFASARNLYRKAVMVERERFGTLDNPNFSLLHRKLATTYAPALMSGSLQVATCSFGDSVCKTIREGDALYFKGNAKASIVKYKHACLIGEQQGNIGVGNFWIFFILSFCFVSSFRKLWKKMLELGSQGETCKADNDGEDVTNTKATAAPTT
jgi:hypothetical protein